MEALQRVFEYLRQNNKGCLMIDVSLPPVQNTIDITVEPDWMEFYPDAVENVSSERPKPMGKLCTHHHLCGCRPCQRPSDQKISFRNSNDAEQYSSHMAFQMSESS